MSAGANKATQEDIGRALAALQRGDAAGALELMQAAERAQPRDLDIKLNLALVHRVRGEFPAALKALDAALALDPYSFLAYLSKGAVLEKMGRTRHAAEVYRNALRIAPPEDSAPPSLVAPIRHARELVAQQSAVLAEHLREELGDLFTEHREEPLGRVQECLDILAGTKRVYHAEPIQLTFPQLPAIPFFDRSYFPWLDQLEAATDMIRGELQALLDAGMPGFSPYITYAPGTPENQFAALNHNRDWSSLWLWKDGVQQKEPTARCPGTTALLAELPLADQPGFAPTALFSALAPHTRIPPHTGSTNTRLLIHLPLVLAGPAGFRVGNEVRQWRLGEAWAFDDTIEHEAWNDADATRVILIFDIWNPLLSAAERTMVSALLNSHRNWLRGSP